MGNGLARELQEVKPAEPVALPSRDVRAGSVPFLGGLLKFETLRRGLRVLTLASLDVAGMFLAIWTALVIKTAGAAPRRWSAASSTRRRTFAPLAMPRDAAALRALGPLPRPRRSGRASPG